MVTKQVPNGNHKPATLTEIAIRAGVSVGAASVALNGSRSNISVSQATRERILQAAAELNYQPNAIARSLRNRRTDVIAFYNAQNVNFDPRYPFYAAVLAGVQTGCSEHKKHLLVHGKFEDQSDDDIFNMLHNGQIDGLVLYVRTVNSLVERLVDSHLPVVTVAEHVPGLPCVCVDEDQGGKLLAHHLVEKGYKWVHYRSVDEPNVPAIQKQRLKAFRDEALALGMRFTEMGNSPVSSLPNPEEQKLLLADPAERPDVMVCWTDAYADGIAAFCLERGIRIPEDIALVGFDHLPSTRRPALRLTTIHAPWDEVARTAVQLLTAQCEGQSVPEKTVLPVELFVGHTT